MVFMAVTGFAVARLRNLFGVVMLTGIFSLMSAVLYVADSPYNQHNRSEDQQAPTDDVLQGLHQMSPLSSPPVGRPMCENWTYLDTAMVAMKLISA